MPVASGNVPPVSSSIVQLRKNYRFDESSGIGQLSKAVNLGEINRTFSILNSSRFTDIIGRPCQNPNHLPPPLRIASCLTLRSSCRKLRLVTIWKSSLNL